MVGTNYLYDQFSIGFTRMKGGQPAELGANSSWPAYVVNPKTKVYSEWQEKNRYNG